MKLVLTAVTLSAVAIATDHHWAWLTLAAFGCWLAWHAGTVPLEEPEGIPAARLWDDQ